MSLPAGTVTFLFTDIEGSARLWEQHPEQMRSALARHDALLREAIARHDGHVFKMVGDAFCAAFSTAPDGLQAALAAQQALLAESWPEPVTLKVRMALHTGAAEQREGDYFGQPLNRVVRLLATGYGGQVLLSEVTHDLCREALPPFCSVQNLGEHRLRDLSRPETVYQLRHSALPSEFPPLRSLEFLPNNLPVQLTSFIGREKQIEEVKSLLARTRLLTLTGSGGCGKTRLSLQVAAEVLEQFPDGVWVVELAPLAGPTLVAQTVASLLGIKEQTGQPLVQTLPESLSSRRLLLLLDNCEHLLAACVSLASALLRSCPHVKLLATSQEALGIAGEQTYRVPSLSLPDPRKILTVEALSQYEAAHLFLERAMLVKSDFVIRDQTAPAVGQLCSRLDGIPLAIELAAARVRSLSVEEINTRLGDRFRLLTGGDRAALPRQQTLRAAMDWSYDLLSERECVLLSRLSVFAGGWTLEAAEAVCTGEEIEDWEVLDLLTELVDKSLVVAETQAGNSRYRLLETIREYAWERLEQREEVEEMRGRHRDYFLARAEEVAPKLMGAEQGVWLERLESEHDNLRTALAWCSAEEDGAEAGLRLAFALLRFWDVRGHYSEGRAYLTEALGREGAAGRTTERARALHGAGALAISQGDYAVARTLFEESLSIRRELGDKQSIAASLHNMGSMAYSQGDFAQARSLFEESLAIRREVGDRPGIATSLHNLGNMAFSQGDFGQARALYEESLALFREMGDKWGAAQVLNNLAMVAWSLSDYGAARALCEQSLATYRELGNKRGIAFALGNLGMLARDQGEYEQARAFQEESLGICRELKDKRGIANSLHNLGNVIYSQGDFGQARALYEESLALFREMGDKWGAAQVLNNLGMAAYRRQDYETARTLYEESLAICRDLSDKRGIAETLEAFAPLKATQSQPERAARLWGAAEALREALHSPLSPNEREEYDRNVTAARAAFGEEAFAAAWQQGRDMTIEQAIEYALQDHP